jgi:putative endonuclease
MNSQKGKKGEEIAKKFYIKKGYNFLDQNFQFYVSGQKGRIGEIDLIFYKNRTIHFIEVKYRTNLKFGNTIEQITQKKIDSLSKTAQHFLNKNIIKTQTNITLLEINKLYLENNLKIQFDLIIIEQNEIKLIENFI